jgi:hypothetical protein
MKHNLITVAIILAIITITALFGALLVESNAQMHHAVSGVYSYNQGSIAFLTIFLIGFALVNSCVVIKVRNADLALRLKSEQKHKEFKEFLAQLDKI